MRGPPCGTGAGSSIEDCAVETISGSSGIPFSGSGEPAVDVFVVAA